MNMKTLVMRVWRSRPSTDLSWRFIAPSSTEQTEHYRSREFSVEERRLGEYSLLACKTTFGWTPFHGPKLRRPIPSGDGTAWEDGRPTRIRRPCQMTDCGDRVRDIRVVPCGRMDGADRQVRRDRKRRPEESFRAPAHGAAPSRVINGRRTAALLVDALCAFVARPARLIGAVSRVFRPTRQRTWSNNDGGRKSS